MRALILFLLVLLAPVLAAQTALDFGRYHALVIGIDDYRHLPRLHSAVADARAVARLLENKYRFRVHLLVDADRSRIITELNALRRELTEDDNLLVYYAGHGVLDGQTGFWMAADALPDVETNWIPVSTLSRNFNQMTARHVLVVSDSCYSGTLVRSVRGSLRTGHEQTRWIERMNEKRSRTALTSGGLEPVLDSGGGMHSVFAKAFLGALGENDAVLDGQSLFDRIKDPVVVNASQTPTYADIRNAGHDFGDFLFVPYGVTVAAAPAPAPGASPALGLREGEPSRSTQDTLFWESIEDSDDPQVYRAYLEAFPNGTFAALARIRLANVSAVDSAPAATGPVSAPELNIEILDQALFTTTPSNVRARPTAKSAKLTTLAYDTEVQVTGKVRGLNWYRVALADGREGYIHASLLAAIEHAPAPPRIATAPNAAVMPNTAAIPNTAGIPGSPDSLRENLKLGVFPFQSVVSCYTPVGKEVADAVGAELSTRTGAELAFSIFSPGIARDDIPPANALWDQNMARGEPEVGVVREVGVGLGLDAVVMAWYYCSQSPRKASSTYKVDVYLLDIATGVRYHSRQTLGRARSAVATVISEYLTDHPRAASR